MKIGFVILNFNSWSLTKKLALKVAAFSSIDKVVVVDNMSTNDSYEHLLEIQSSKIDVFQSERNGGYSYGNNLGVKRCKDLGMDIVFISNPDVDVEEESIIKITEGFQDTNYSMLSGVEYDIKGELSEPPLWNMMDFGDDLLDCFFIARKLLKKKKGYKLNEALDIQPAEMIKGSFFAVRTDAFIECGGFDEHVFLFCEERILSRKFKESNKGIGIVTKAKYQHNHSATINKEYKAKAEQMKLLYKSRTYYNVKYNKINRIQYGMLKMAMALSVCEFKCMDLVRGGAIGHSRKGR